MQRFVIHPEVPRLLSPLFGTTVNGQRRDVVATVGVRVCPGLLGGV